MAILALALVVVQSPDEARVRELVEKIRSVGVEDREEASRELRDLGPPAIPWLQKHVSDPDAEVAERVRMLLVAFHWTERLPAGVRRGLPGIEDRMARSRRGWTEAFFFALGIPHHYRLGREDQAVRDFDRLLGLVRAAVERGR